MERRTSAAMTTMSPIPAQRTHECTGPPGSLRPYPPGRRLSPLRVTFGALGRRPRGERLHGLGDAASQPVGVELGVVDEGDLVLLVPVRAVVGSPRAARTGRSQAGGRGR